MTPERLLSKVCDFSTPFNTSREVLPPQSRLTHPGDDYPFRDKSKTGSGSPTA